MAGLTPDPYCHHRDNCLDPDGDPLTNTFKGKCGGCLGECQPCDEAGDNCGEWQDCACAGAGTCGTGHECKRYIDIEFSLGSFTIQGEYCCQGSPPLAQPCGGGFNNTPPFPVEGNPAGWGDVTGVIPAVTYPATTHRIRLTRTDCGCFWGGYWSSSCDLMRCCVEEPDTMHLCGDGACDDQHDCEDCDPENPCANIDDGWASSLDDWGDGGGGEQGGVAGAMCLSDDGYIQGDCDYSGGDCTEPNDAFTACKSCGSFKPFHIEAFLSHAESNCQSSWRLEIRGMTEQIRQQASMSGSGCDSQAAGGVSSPPSPNPFAKGTQWALFRGRWEGCNTSGCGDCECCGGHWSSVNNCHYIKHAQCNVDEFKFEGCGCPPELDFYSSVIVDNNTRQLHPTFNVYDDCVWTTCQVDHEDCGTPADHPAASHCLGDDCYGTPTTWAGACKWDACCEWGDASGCESVDCDVPSGTSWMWNDYAMPCSVGRCTHGTTEDDCEECDGSSSKLCADARVKMVPNNNVLPWWTA